MIESSRSGFGEDVGFGDMVVVTVVIVGRSDVGREGLVIQSKSKVFCHDVVMHFIFKFVWYYGFIYLEYFDCEGYSSSQTTPCHQENHPSSRPLSASSSISSMGRQSLFMEIPKRLSVLSPPSFIPVFVNNTLNFYRSE